MLLSIILQASPAAASQISIWDRILPLCVIPLFFLLALVIIVNKDTDYFSSIRDIKADRRDGLISRWEAEDLIKELKKERRESFRMLTSASVLGVLAWISAIILVFAFAFLLNKVTNGFFEDHPFFMILLFIIEIVGVSLLYYHLSNRK